MYPLPQRLMCYLWKKTMKVTTLSKTLQIAGIQCESFCFISHPALRKSSILVGCTSGKISARSCPGRLWALLNIEAITCCSTLWRNSLVTALLDGNGVILPAKTSSLLSQLISNFLPAIDMRKTPPCIKEWGVNYL